MTLQITCDEVRFVNLLKLCLLIFTQACTICTIHPYSGWFFLGLLTEEGGGEAKGPLPKKSFTCILTMISKAVPYQKKIQYINHVTQRMSSANICFHWKLPTYIKKLQIDCILIHSF